MVQDASAEQDIILIYMTLINSKLLYYSSFNATVTDIKKCTRSNKNVLIGLSIQGYCGKTAVQHRRLLE